MLSSKFTNLISKTIRYQNNNLFHSLTSKNNRCVSIQTRLLFTTTVENSRKRAPTTYNIYFSEEVAKIKLSNPSLSFPDIRKQVTTKWTALSPEEKTVSILILD